MKRLLACALWIGTIAVPLSGLTYAESPRTVLAGLRTALHTGMFDATIFTSLLVYLSAVTWCVVLLNVVHSVVSSVRRGTVITPPRYTGVLASALLLMLAQRNSTAVSNTRAEQKVPVTAVASPILAAGLLADLLSRRRRQQTTLAIGVEPDVVADADYEKLVELSDTRPTGACDLPPSVALESADAESLIKVVERTRPLDTTPLADEHIDAHRIVVRTLGYPIVENVAGVSAVFRKTRSLELITWLVFNRQRMRRSAARTAMWDGTVSDSSFATVVSDARRGMSELCPGTDPREWLPPTFSDELPLSSLVVSDCDLLRSAMAKFREEPSAYSQLVVHHLDGVRDLPFAGTNYRWPDLDGTTTRVVMLVLTAVNDVVEYCIETDDGYSAMRALAAGLRMMPGHDVLLRLQKKLCIAEPARVETLLSERHDRRLLA